MDEEYINKLKSVHYTELTKEQWLFLENHRRNNINAIMNEKLK